MRRAAAAILSLVSLLGGHCLNRRWDRVVVFATLAVLIALAAWLSAFWNISYEASAESLTADLEWAQNLFASGLVLLLITSTVFSVMDARSPSSESGRVAPMLAGIVASVLAVPLIAVTLLPLLSPFGIATGPGEFQASADGSRQADHRYNFVHHIWLGQPGAAGVAEDLEEPAAGTARIRGQVRHRGEPQPGVLLRLYLDGRYATSMVETDEQGMFSVPVAPGEWRVDQIRTRSWAGKPGSGHFTVVSGHEPAFELPYQRMNLHAEDPLVVHATPDATEPQIELTIRRAIELRWPPAGHESTPANAQEDVISWDGRADAARYAVTVQRIEEDGNTTHYLSRTAVQTEDTQLPLSALPVVDAMGETSQYTVDVHAFDASDRLLNYTPAYLADHHFTLEDRKLASNTDWVDIDAARDRPAPEAEVADWNARTQANRRVETIRHLIEEALYEPADTLLERIEPEHVPPGELPLLRGYLAASRGQCARAETHFEAARSEDPGICIASCYRADCPSPKDSD